MCLTWKEINKNTLSNRKSVFFWYCDTFTSSKLYLFTLTWTSGADSSCRFWWTLSFCSLARRDFPTWTACKCAAVWGTGWCGAPGSGSPPSRLQLGRLSLLLNFVINFSQFEELQKFSNLLSLKMFFLWMRELWSLFELCLAILRFIRLNVIRIFLLFSLVFLQSSYSYSNNLTSSGKHPSETRFCWSHGKRSRNFLAICGCSTSAK